MMDINKLRELASKATPGPWKRFYEGGGTHLVYAVANPDDEIAVTHGAPALSDSPTFEVAAANADYIAAASPDVLLALLDVAEKAKVLIAYESEGAEAGWPNWDERFDALRTSLAALGEQGK
jgi:hypothetical protein